MMLRNFLKILPLVILVLAIGLSPRIPIGTLPNGKSFDIRVEDIALFLFGLYWLVAVLRFRIHTLQKPPLLLPILAWVGMGICSTLINLAMLNIPQPSRTFFYFLKEIEYFFLFFYVFYHIKSIDSAKIIIRVWLFVASTNALWVIFQLISGLHFTYYYGPTPFIEPEGTFPGGGFFLITFIFLLNVFLYYDLALNISFLRKMAIFLLLSSLAVGILSSGSRTIVLGCFIATLASFLIYAIRMHVWRALLVWSFMVIYVFGIFIISPPPASEKFSHTSPSMVIQRISNIEGIKKNLDPAHETSRPEIWIYQFKEMAKKPFSFIFGLGKGAILGERAVGESHSQYMRNFVETGIMGLAIFIFLICSIFRKSLKGLLVSRDTFLTGVLTGLFCSTVAMATISLFAEGFLVVKINEAFWFFAALTFAVLHLNGFSNRNKHEQNTLLAQ